MSRQWATFDELVQLTDDELQACWQAVCGLHKSQAVCRIDATKTERRASLVYQALDARGIVPADGLLLLAAKARSTLSERLAMLPDLIPLPQSEIALTKQQDGALGLLGGFYHPDDRATVAKALQGVGVPVTAEADQCGDDDLTAPVYELALVRTNGSEGPDPAPPRDGAWETGTAAESEARATFIARSAPERQIIYYLVSEPDTDDAHGERISAQAIEDALHGYMANSRRLRVEHGKDGELRFLAPQRGGSIDGRAVVVEAFIAPMDLDTFHGQKPPDGPIKRGSSIVAIHYTDRKLWDELKSREHGISWGGYARKVQR